MSAVETSMLGDQTGEMAPSPKLVEKLVEQAIDRLEDVANTVESIVLKQG